MVMSGRSIHHTIICFMSMLDKAGNQYFVHILSAACNWQQPEGRNYFMINLHESIGPGRDLTRDLSNCSQTRIGSQTRYRLRYATRYIYLPYGGQFAKSRETCVFLMPTRWSSLRDRNRYSRAYRVKSDLFGQTAKFGQPPCLFHSSTIGIKIENTRWVSFDIKFTRQGFENACWHREACRAIQIAFSKPSLVNLISKDANLVFYLSVYPLLNTLQTSDYDVIFDVCVDSASLAMSSKECNVIMTW